MLFTLGETVITAGAMDLLDGAEALQLLVDHAELKPGVLGEADQELNRDALRDGDRILSAFVVRGEKFYVITEHDRSLTTVLLASEY